MADVKQPCVEKSLGRQAAGQTSETWRIQRGITVDVKSTHVGPPPPDFRDKEGQYQVSQNTGGRETMADVKETHVISPDPGIEGAQRQPETLIDG